MSEPVSSTIGGMLGVKYGTLVAGAIGGLISLHHIEELSGWGRMLAILSGMAVAGYGTPVMDAWLDLSPSLENAVAFFLGLTAMNIIPGLLKVSELFRNDPLGFIRRTHSSRKGDA